MEVGPCGSIDSSPLRIVRYLVGLHDANLIMYCTYSRAVSVHRYPGSRGQLPPCKSGAHVCTYYCMSQMRGQLLHLSAAVVCRPSLGSLPGATRRLSDLANGWERAADLLDYWPIALYSYRFFH